MSFTSIWYCYIKQKIVCVVFFSEHFREYGTIIDDTAHIWSFELLLDRFSEQNTGIKKQWRET